MQEENVTKSVPVYALQSPDKKVVLHFLYPDTYLQDPENAGKPWHYEEAAIISFVYNLTEHRRPQPSVEPERSIYKNLRPWKKLLIPKYVVIADKDDLTGSTLVAWDGKKSLQGVAPWGRPVIGTVSGAAGNWEVAVDPIQIAILEKQEESRLAQAEEKARKVEQEAAAARAALLPPTPEPAPVFLPVPPPVVVPEPAFCAVEEPETDPTLDYHGDKFEKMMDGHFLGDDGFVVPMDFDEFYERYPKYVLNWVKKRLNRFSIDDDVEDWTQDLLIHMKFLPQGSKHRTPGANGRPNGCSDVIETFNPYQQYGASERRFRNYINFCLANKFNTMQSKRQKNPVCRPGNIPYGIASDDTGSQQSTGDEFVHANSQHLTNLAEKKMKQHDDALFTNQFKRYVKKEDPAVYPAIEALEATGPLGEAAMYMGVTEQEFSRYRARLKQLGECFIQACQVPKQRKKYKKRNSLPTE